MFTVTFHVEETGVTRAVRVDPGGNPPSRIGVAGSILGIAAGAGVEIDHVCGGVCACTTCHVKVRDGLTSCPGPTADERDMLEVARGRDASSRLACQCVPDGTRDLEVVIPRWYEGRPGG